MIRFIYASLNLDRSRQIRQQPGVALLDSKSAEKYLMGLSSDPDATGLADSKWASNTAPG